MEKGNYEYETMTFSFDNYKNDDALWQDVAKFQQMLMHNGYECAVHQEDHIVVVVQYNHAKWNNYGNATIHWVDCDTWEEMKYLHNEQVYDNKDDDEILQDDN